MSNQKLGVNTLREIKRVLSNRKEQDSESESPDTGITEILLLTFDNIYKEGCSEISLKDEDMKEYIIEIQKMFKTLNIEHPTFIKKSLEISAITLKEAIIQILYEEDYGYYEEETKILYISTNGRTEYKKENISNKSKKIIETLSKLILEKSKQPHAKQKKLTNKTILNT